MGIYRKLAKKHYSFMCTEYVYVLFLEYLHNSEEQRKVRDFFLPSGYVAEKPTTLRAKKDCLSLKFQFLFSELISPQSTVLDGCSNGRELVASIERRQLDRNR